MLGHLAWHCLEAWSGASLPVLYQLCNAPIVFIIMQAWINLNDLYSCFMQPLEQPVIHV